MFFVDLMNLSSLSIMANFLDFSHTLAIYEDDFSLLILSMNATKRFGEWSIYLAEARGDFFSIFLAIIVE